MRKDVKIILIVVGSLAALVVLVFIAAVGFVVNGAVQSVASNRDPARQARVAAKIADFSSIVVETDVPEGRLHLVTKGRPCEIVLDAYPDRRWRGRQDAARHVQR